MKIGAFGAVGVIVRRRQVSFAVDRAVWLIAIYLFVDLAVGCSVAPPPAPPVTACSEVSSKPAAVSSNVLAHYDAAVTQLLNATTSHPTSNNFGAVVWGTRYYMESLLVAYTATGNPKYISSLIDTGNTVLSLAQTLQVPDVVDPGSLDPSQATAAPQRTVIGWPSNMGTLGQLIPVPTADGNVSLYAQTLWPAAPGYLVISASTSGGVVLNFELEGRVWQSYTAITVSDLDSIASQPIIYGGTLGRIIPTGEGLPSPGVYALNFPLQAIWHAEQTGGILLPFVRFLLLAKEQPSIADAGTVADWQSQVLAIAQSYEDEFIPDGQGGLVLTNAYWMPSPYAGLPVETDYINAEISLRMLLGMLTSDPHEFALARGLFAHEMSKIPLSASGWLLVKESADAPSWSQSQVPPYGSIWASYKGDTTSPESTTEGGFLVETLQIASDYGLGNQIGLTDAICSAERNTFQQYLRIPAPGVGNSLIRSGYPTATSQASDTPIPSNDPEDAARYVQPVTQDSTFVCDNWNWMLKNGITTDEGVGHVLLDWARSETAWEQLAPSQCPSQ